MTDDDPPDPTPAFVPFAFDARDVRAYLPLLGVVVRVIPNTPAALASARNSLRWSRAAWQN